MHPDAAPAPDARRTKMRIERTEKPNTQERKRTYTTGTEEKGMFFMQSLP